MVLYEKLTKKDRKLVSEWLDYCITLPKVYTTNYEKLWDIHTRQFVPQYTDTLYTVLRLMYKVINNLDQCV